MFTAPGNNDQVTAQSAGVHVITLEPLKTVGGVVQTSAGKPLVGAQVCLASIAHGAEIPGADQVCQSVEFYDYIAYTDADGHWQTNLFPHSRNGVRLRVVHPEVPRHGLGYRTLDADQTQRLFSGKLVTTVSPALALARHVVDETGKPIAGATIRLRCNGIGPLGQQTGLTQSDPQGGFRFDNFSSGSAVLIVTAPGRAPEVLTTVIAETPPAARIQLQPGAVLRGRLVDEEGDPIAGAIVRIFAWRGLPATPNPAGRPLW